METELPEYYDPRDLSICVSGSTPLGDILKKVAADGLTYPLVYDPSKGIADHIRSYPFCSASFMYGPQADNVLGMNIRLNNKKLKIGGRTVKNCTGLDLVRFICNSSAAICEIEEVVLRLRPTKDIQRWIKVSGDFDALNRFRQTLLKSPWSYETTAMDVYANKEAVHLLVCYSCTSAQSPLFKTYFSQLAEQHHLSLKECAVPDVLHGASVRVKTVMSDLMPRLQRWITEHGGEAYGFCGNGYALYRPDSETFDPEKEHRELARLGGHIEADGFTALADAPQSLLAEGFEARLASLSAGS